MKKPAKIDTEDVREKCEQAFWFTAGLAIAASLCLLSEYSDCELFILSGRDSVCREKTEIWLDRHLRLEHTLLMRPMKDTRDDAIVKSEMFDMHIDNQYDVQFVVDDRQKVVDTWREKGLTVFQVADGRF